MEELIDSYLSFLVGKETFAINVSKVNEIKEYEEPRNMPEALSFMKGVIDHREEVIPVIDTAVKFGMSSSEITTQTCIIVIDIEKKEEGKTFKIGIITDAVSDVFEADKDKFKIIDNDYRPNYIDATYNNEDKHYLMINVDQIFSNKDIIDLEQIINS